ncbi:DEAD/DEAH box helicase [Peribacillus asahii]|uniref:DEAD/DEAH box helicase n=1 Tax=Peribacillus asahii TaxID=228899 RepID=UPI00257ECDBE|nr:DEAD/DEAH box helicase [Peribacillus asahii]
MNPISHSPLSIPQQAYSTELQHHLFGRQLLAAEIPFSLDVLETHIEQGYVAKTFGIELDHCIRCGNQDKQLFYTFPCAICRQLCTYCRSCIMMGRVSECTPLYTWTGPAYDFHVPKSVMNWSGTLSEGQQTASDRVKQVILHQEELLVWAVCGAGKTEVLFAGIEAGLLAGKRICIATPRTDVVLELAPRLKKAFPFIEVAALYGGSDDRHKLAPLTVATTHQLFRFKEAFDAMIIDEVDAFPYSMDPSLHYAVQKAKKQTAATIYLTATPSRQMKKQYRSGKLQAVTIPARYHRQPIPVPEMKWCGNWAKQFQQKKIPRPVQAWVNERLQSQTPILLFFPSIAVMETARPLFQNLPAVYAEHPNRKERVQALRDGELQGLLTTTILERGVTIERLEVAVIGAEHEVFTESALVQIAGRVGRSFAYPTGSITFFHYGKSKAMVEAIKHITSMNEEARKRGLLDG